MTEHCISTELSWLLYHLFLGSVSTVHSWHLGHTFQAHFFCVLWHINLFHIAFMVTAPFILVISSVLPWFLYCLFPAHFLFAFMTSLPYIQSLAVMHFHPLQTPQQYKDSDFKQYWLPDSVSRECYECEEKFTTFRRRHHCRVCGQIFCSRCCNSMIPGKVIGYTGEAAEMVVCGYVAKVNVTFH